MGLSFFFFVRICGPWGLSVIYWALGLAMGLPLLQFLFLFLFFFILVQICFFGLFFFYLKVEQIIFFFLKFEGVPNFVTEGVPNTKQI